MRQDLVSWALAALTLDVLTEGLLDDGLELTALFVSDRPDGLEHLRGRLRRELLTLLSHAARVA